MTAPTSPPDPAQTPPELVSPAETSPAEQRLPVRERDLLEEAMCLVTAMMVALDRTVRHQQSPGTPARGILASPELVIEASQLVSRIAAVLVTEPSSSD
ncbi:hypothetical protein BJF78_26220 [Pseudonocardia sp. CNS-139]|nr:hypothetical protein BJF78_26220 [Pseudonocardia sp. CNS-139]